MDGIKERISRAVRNQPQPTVTILSSLLAVEDELAYIPKQAIEEVAALMRATINDVWAVASFYPNFRFNPPCDHQIEICWGPSCHIKGAMGLIESVLDGVGMSDEGDTPDGKITIRYNTCLGACSQAPVISIDHHLIGRVSLEQAKALTKDTLDLPAHLGG
jgi:NADH:ubiquinone oxidoreductase subunit E